MLAALEVEADSGLGAGEARARLGRHGPNLLRQREKAKALEILVRQFMSPVVALLAVAAAVALAFDDVLEAAAIATMLVINAAIGFVCEVRALRSMEAPSELGRVTTRVRRDGAVRELAAESLVPGDIVVLEAGDVVTVDLRLVEAENLSVNESALTENRMTLSRVAVASGTTELEEGKAASDLHPLAARALTIGVLCNNAVPTHDDDPASGDPVEVALIEAGRALGLERDALEAETPRIHTTSFESETAMMATEHLDGDGFVVCV